MELPGEAPPENEVDDDVVPSLLPSDYDGYNESDEKGVDIYTSTKQRQRVILSEFMPPMVRDVYNIRAWKQHDYVNDDINLLMLFAQV